jgi:hypothetical protein
MAASLSVGRLGRGCAVRSAMVGGGVERAAYCTVKLMELEKGEIRAYEKRKNKSRHERDRRKMRHGEVTVQKASCRRSDLLITTPLSLLFSRDFERSRLPHSSFSPFDHERFTARRADPRSKSSRFFSLLSVYSASRTLPSNVGFATWVRFNNPRKLDSKLFLFPSLGCSLC